MGDIMTPARDDAPASTSQHGEERAALGSGPGDSVTAKTVTINRPRQAPYDYWRTLENLPAFMANVEEVQALGGGRCHWVAPPNLC